MHSKQELLQSDEQWPLRKQVLATVIFFASIGGLATYMIMYPAG